ncbi:MFS transporter [Candidatus Woesearchaeota archaeon]|nr:MFS transporter [Candidatus Woesearchaeota archaeon]
MKSLTKKIFGWTIYDLANTAFSALYVTFFFPLLIKVYLGGNEFHVGLVTSLGIFFAGAFVPFIGALSDSTGRKMPYVIFFTLLCVTATALTPYVGLYGALILGVLATLTFHASLDVYDAILVDISTKKNMSKISGYGVAVGYIGTILSLIMAYILMSILGWDTEVGVKSIFPATAIFFLGFAMITFVIVKDKVKKATIKLKEGIKKAWSALKSTFVEIRKHRSLFIFLIACLLYTDGMNTAIVFLYLYGREQIGISMINFFYAYAGMALTAALGSVIFGRLGDKLGSKKSIVIALWIWIGIISLLRWIEPISLFIRISNVVTFIVAGCLGGAALGAIWTLNRPMLVHLSPKHKVAEFFGFQGLTEKFSGLIGPSLFGFVVVKAGYPPALMVLMAFFVIGLGIMWFVPNK